MRWLFFRKELLII